MMMKKAMLIVVAGACLLGSSVKALAVNLRQCRIVTAKDDAPLVRKMAAVMSADIERVTGVAPDIDGNGIDGGKPRRQGKEGIVVLTTVEKAADVAPDVDVRGLKGRWEMYRIVTKGDRMVIIGSDARGLAYGVLRVSEKIGVSPWYWWADVPVKRRGKLDVTINEISREPSVKYRGIFINDEDWGLKTWAAKTFEPDLGDIGPKTYDKVCELILRLKGNMLAPAMHTCTGAFYSHPESQRVAAEWGIMITTSHCEPLLFNNAAPSEWTKDCDGEWNYLTNKETIWRKLDQRIADTRQYDNIYTMGMRGLHDEAMKGSTDPRVRARTLETVFADQREILARHKKRPIEDIPQIFVPYKETLDIYDAGLRVPDDITLVWPDDNYGYMKRVSNASERTRSGGAGVYYHLSYLGTPHDNLWIATTAPVLMYHELKKAYDAGARRYWLLNVGDIKPMEMEMQQFFDMAWNLDAFTIQSANTYQAEWLARTFAMKSSQFQHILDSYYRLAWQRKPEFMGYEMEWDSEENNRLHDSDLTPEEREQRLAEYRKISDAVDKIERRLPTDFRPAFFEIIGYAVKSAYQINRKFLMAQENHETGRADAASEARAANDSILSLMARYNTQLGGKWNEMISQIPPGYTAKYHLMPELVNKPTTAYRLPDGQRRVTYKYKVDLRSIKAEAPFRLIEGIGKDWVALQMGEPKEENLVPGNLAAVIHTIWQDQAAQQAPHVDIPLHGMKAECDSVKLCISTVPFWPLTKERSNRFGVSVDGCTPVVCENKIVEWSMPWKLQVLENRKDYILTLPLDRTKKHHLLTLIIMDPGQMVQQISFSD